MSEILSNTGVKLWAETDYSELWLTVFDQLTGQGGKSNIRLIDEAIGKINAALDGYKFEFSSDEDRLYISKGDSKLPVSLIDSNGHVASKVDGTTITIDESGVVKGIPVDDALSEESTNPLQNKVIAGELKSIKSKIGTDESAIKQNTSNITSNTKRIEANETAISTLNGTGNGSVKKAVSDGIAKVVAGAPEDFDTLKEMSDWISTHETSASAMNSAIKDNKSAITALQIGKADKTEIPIVPTNVSEFTNDAGYLTEHQDISNLVVKEEGKGLSSNDYTSEEKTKLGGVGTSQGRNIIPYPYSQTTKTVYGVTFTDNKDGSIGISGTQDGSTSRPYMGVGIWWGTDKKEGNIKIDANTYFTISANCSSDNAGICYYVYDESGSKLADNIVYGTATKTLKFDVDTWVALCIETAANSETYDCICKPQLELGTIAHAYEPSIESNVNLKKEIDKTSTLQGQNLIPYPYYRPDSYTNNGITWTVNEDGSVTANGTASKDAPYSLIYPYNLSTMKSLQLGNTYIISDGLTDEQHTNVGYMQLVRYDKNNPTNWKYGVSSMKGTEIYTANDENTLQYGIRLIIRNGATANNITFKPMLEVGTMSHEYQPTTISNTSLNERLSDQQGQNLIPYPYYRPDSYTNNGITWTVNEDGSVTANGTATATAHYTVFIGKLGLEIGKNYVLTITTVKGQASLYLTNKNKQNINTDIAACRTVNNSTLSVIFKYSQTDDFDRDELGLYIVAGTTLTNCIIKFQLERGTIRHEYQPTTLSNPTLKKEIGSALQPESIVNNQTTTVVGFALDARQANPNIDGSLAKQISDLNGSLNSKKIPSFGIENIFTGNPFCIVNNGSDVISVQTDWDIDNGGYRVKNIKYPAGTATNLTVSLSLPANSIVIVDVNTLNGENIDIQGSLIRSNFTSSPKKWNLSIKFTGRTNQIFTDIRYMPLVIHLG